jgi:hypothetical protein
MWKILSRSFPGTVRDLVSLGQLHDQKSSMQWYLISLKVASLSVGKSVKKEGKVY